MKSGIINIYKQKGYTSFDVVAKLRGILGIRKIGHTGTLDPDATGVLPVCIGRATKVCDLLTDKDKTYEAVMRLGVVTDTQDMTGTILQEREVAVTEGAIREVMASFVGESQQIPPMYSALKVNGQKLCDLARKGIEVERAPRDITIYDIDIKDIDLPLVTFSVTCSKGTYVRTICQDIGEELGCGACMESLVRTRVSCFDLSEGFTLEEVEKLRDDGEIEEHMISVEEIFADYHKVIGLPEADKKLYNGNKLSFDEVENEDYTFTEGERVRMYLANRTFVGVFSVTEGLFKPEKMFLE